ncbi:MAG: phosphoribulokinase [Alphaproteobacteria bacterium]
MSGNQRAVRPVVLGIAGDSAAGKTTLADGIARILGPERVTILCTDDYLRCSRWERERNGLSALDPRSNYVDILEQHLRLLRNGEPILKPRYHHEDGTLGPPEYVEPREYLLLEGLLSCSTDALREACDVKVFLEPDATLRRDWKIRRDCDQRGYALAEVVESLENPRQDDTDRVQSQRAFADIVVQFYRSGPLQGETGGSLNVRTTLRPTLPHPDLTPILDIGVQNGLRLDLSRDEDGNPVDVLEIMGDIDDHRAGAMEALLWGLIPGAAPPGSAGVGQFVDGANGLKSSHSLALSQLLVAYHLPRA